MFWGSDVSVRQVTSMNQEDDINSSYTNHRNVTDFPHISMSIELCLIACFLTNVSPLLVARDFFPRIQMMD